MMVKKEIAEYPKGLLRSRLHELVVTFLICSLQFVIYNSFAQNAKNLSTSGVIDSLKKVLLTSKEDTNKVNALDKLASMFVNNNPDSTIILAQHASTLAQKLNYNQGKAKSELLMGIASINLGNNHDALIHLNTALNICKDKKTTAQILGTIGIVYHNQADYPEALYYYQQSFKFTEESGDRNRMAMQLGNIGSVFHEQGDYVKALEYYFKSLTVIEKLGNKSLEATTIGNIGSVYHNQGDYAKALNYYFKSLKISKELGDKQSISVWLGNIGSSYIELANKTSPDSAAYRAELFTKALNYYLNALKIAEEIGNKQYISSWLGNLGNLYEYQIEYPKALKHYLGALKLTNEVGDKNSMVHQLSNIGSLYSKQKKYKEAKEYFKQSLAVATKIGLNDWCQYNCQKLSAIDSALGNYKSAFANYKMHIVYKDSVQNEENTKRQTRTEMQYEFDKKQASDSIRNAEQAEREKLRHDQELKQQRTYTYGGIIGFLLMMVVAGVSYRAYRQKQKANKIIAEQKRKVEEKQKEILDSIHYAKRIQQSLLPAEKYIEKKLNELNKK